MTHIFGIIFATSSAYFFSVGFYWWSLFFFVLLIFKALEGRLDYIVEINAEFDKNDKICGFEIAESCQEFKIQNRELIFKQIRNNSMFIIIKPLTMNNNKLDKGDIICFSANQWFKVHYDGTYTELV